MKSKKSSEKRILPKLRFPEFINYKSWDYKYGDKIFDSIANKDHNSDLPILAISQEFGALPREMIDYKISVSEKSLKSYKIVEEGDFIISLRSFQGGIEYSNYKGICSPAYIILRKNRNIHDIFYKHYFKSSGFIQLLNKNLEGLRDGKMVSYKQFSEILLPYPDPEEQKKIADCLTSIDELIILQGERLESLIIYRRGLITQLFPLNQDKCPKLNFYGQKNINPWKFKPLEEMCENLDSKRVPIKEGDRISGKVPYYGASGIIDYVDGYIFDESLLCISEDGANLRVRKYPIAFSISGKSWVNNHAHVLKFANKSTQLLVESYLNSINLEDYLTGMAQPKLNRAKMNSIPIPLPGIPEQKKIASLIETLNIVINTQKKKVIALKEHKKALVQQLFPSMHEVK